MDLALKRLQHREDGIFGDLRTSDGQLFAQTLEHAYAAADGYSTLYLPKVPKGAYTCRRSLHRLHGMTEDFETFEVMDVPKCVGILFHWGNFNKDSEGCILLGLHLALTEGQKQMITDSRVAFDHFMRLQDGVNEFQLTVD